MHKEDAYYIKPTKEMVKTAFPNPITDAVKKGDDEKIATIEKHYREILKTLGLDIDDPSLSRTPRRIAEMYVKEVFSGLNPKTFPRISIIKEEEHKEQGTQMVFVKVSFTSFCEHHLVPIHGTAYVAYKPHHKLIGLSKIPRIVKFFAKRPQLQERLTAQIADSLASILETEDVAVTITATHFCVVARGVEDRESNMTTNVLRGRFKEDPEAKREFFEAVNR